MVHLGVGSVYAWSMFNLPLTRELGGGLVAAADDWALGAVVPVFSAAALCFGATTWGGGAWVDRAGPRKAAALSGALMGGGLLLSGVAVHLHLLPLLYLGYGALVGCSWGLGYLSPVSPLLKWFPDRRGMATSLAVCGFGGGAFLATPLIDRLLALFARPPRHLSPPPHSSLAAAENFHLSADGRQWLGAQEVVMVAQNELPQSSLLEPGLYLVGSGSTGVAATFCGMGLFYWALMTTGAFLIRLPPPNWLPPSSSTSTSVVTTPPVTTETALVATGSMSQEQERVWAQSVLDQRLLKNNSAAIAPGRHVHHEAAVRTPQFYLLWTQLFGNALAGVSLFACAKTVMTEVFQASLPLVVTGAFSGGYIAALSAVNLAGRLGWGTLSDSLGRKRTYLLFGLGVPLTCALPLLTQAVSAGSSVLPLALFCGGTALLVSFYGGTFAVLPAMLADVFGSRHVSAIHGRVLTAWGSCAFVGPLVVSSLRARSYDAALASLAAAVDPAAFRDEFGAPLEQLDVLATAKTVTIPKLLAIAPPGTVDPTPMLYDTSLYTMTAFLAIAFCANAALHPVHPRHYTPDPTIHPTSDSSTTASSTIISPPTT